MMMWATQHDPVSKKLMTMTTTATTSMSKKRTLRTMTLCYLIGQSGTHTTMRACISVMILNIFSWSRLLGGATTS